jgi:TRAP-type transport system small permease protein
MLRLEAIAVNERNRSLIGFIHSLLNGSQKLLEILLVVLTVAIVVLVFLQVVFRYLFFFAISWSEEMATFLFIWAVLLGAAIGFRQQAHLGINLFTKRLNRPFARILVIITHVIVIVFFIVVMVYGWKVAIDNMARIAYTVDLPVGYIRMALPLMAFFSVIFEIEVLSKIIRNFLSEK